MPPRLQPFRPLFQSLVLICLLLAGCGGRGGNVGTAVTEQSILKYINESRKAANMGLSPVKNDPTLANAAAKLLEEFSKTPAKTDYGTGYKMTKTAAEDILHTATGKRSQEIKSLYDMHNGSFFYLAPIGISTTADLYLLHRGDKVFDSTNHINGYINSIEYFCPDMAIMASDVKVGIAFREIKGERFALLVYDVTITT